MQYLASIDYRHLDNGVFLTSLARSIARQQQVRPILLHGDSPYTERVIQTGVMREEATVRSIKDLNHRLIALLADEGVSAVGLNGYQRQFITLENGTLSLDRSYFDRLPEASALLVSTLVYEAESGRPRPMPLSRMAAFLQEQLPVDRHFIFSASDADELFTQEEKPEELRWDAMEGDFRETYLPEEFRDSEGSLHLTTAGEFHRIPDLSRCTYLH